MSELIPVGVVKIFIVCVLEVKLAAGLVFC